MDLNTMTKVYLLDYECMRCGKLKRTYFEVNEPIDKKVVKMFYEEIDLGYVFVTLNKIFKRLNMNRMLLCPKCRKHVDLRQYTSETVRAEGLCPTCKRVTPHVMTDNIACCVVCQT